MVNDDLDTDKLLNGADSEVTIVAGDSIVHRLPGGETFDITCLPGFAELPANCQWYLDRWYNSNMQTTLSATMSGTTPAMIKQWRKEIPNFEDIEEMIRSIYREGLQSIHFTEALSNSKIRGQVLKAMRAEGYEEKQAVKTQNNVLVLDAGQSKDGIASFVRQLKGSAQRVGE